MARLKKRSDGRYQKQVYLGTVDGKRQYKTFFGTTQKEVESKAAEYKAAIGKGFDPTRKDTVRFICDSYVALKRAEGVGSSWLRAIQGYIKHLGPVLQMSAADVRSADLQCAINTQSHLSHTTLNQIYGTWSAIFRQAVPEVIQYNPMDKVSVPGGKPKKSREALDEIQQKWIIETPHRAQRAAMLMMYSGLRRGEAAALTWKDIDLTSGTITVNKAVDAATGDLKEPKTQAGKRVVNIPTVLVEYLKEQKASDSCIYVLHTVDGRRMTEQAWKVLWNSYMADLNVKYGYDGQANKYASRKKNSFSEQGKLPIVIRTFTIHQLRHTFCSMLYLAGVDALTARDQMGHSNISTTLSIYTHLDKQYKRSSMSRLDEYINASQMQVSQTEKTV